MNEAVWSMTWRRFRVLVRGLSPSSLWALHLRARLSGHASGVRRLTDPSAIESFMRGLATKKAVA